ncbi:hypothetical protein TNCV_4903721 [Trichonephila clavipes]|uniref:Transposase n=1 Tax=Trichonephila clavipes TaxID=2585209 RepID=A0A8X6VID7_TRICX|nr:hypothetical protein TNCV_4903721 [Trichonephila clavipes]
MGSLVVRASDSRPGRPGFDARCHQIPSGTRRKRRPTRVRLFNVRHRSACLAWIREHRDCSVEEWKPVAWRHESRF